LYTIFSNIVIKKLTFCSVAAHLGCTLHTAWKDTCSRLSN